MSVPAEAVSSELSGKSSGELSSAGLQDEAGETEFIHSPKSEDRPSDSQVYTATSLTLTTEKEDRVKTQPLTLDWAFGINPALPVFSLLDQDRLTVLYGCSHVAVIYDHTSNSQRLLQGHCSPISCLCVSDDRRWLVTADRGQESLVIVWDAYTGIPVRTMFDSHPEGGVAAVALSNESQYLVTVGAGAVQRVCIWDWTNEAESPECQTDISPEHGFQNHVVFNPADHSQLLSNSGSQVLFYSWDQGVMEYSAPEISDKTFKKEVGPLSQSVFSSSGVQAFSVTLLGNLVLWDVLNGSAAHQNKAMKATKLIPLQNDGITTFKKEVGPLSQSVFSSSGVQAFSVTLLGNLVLWDVLNGSAAHQNKAMKATKLIPLQNDGITVLTLCDSSIVTGDVNGHVKFYDENFKLTNWYSEFNLDPIASISFSKEIPSSSSSEHQEHDSLKTEPFVSRNFVLSTVSAAVVHVNAESNSAQTLLKEHAESLVAVACHPKQALVAMGSHSGLLKVWNYENKRMISSRMFHTDKQIQCITYDPQGFYVAVGFASGAVQVLDACSLQKEGEESFHYSQDCITHLTFSHDSSYLAAADTGKAVTVFQLCKEGSQDVWRYLGRHHSHYKPIQDLLFGVQLDSTQPRLISLGMDRRLVEYDLQNSKKDELLILSSDRIEQSAVPTCMAWYPPLTTEHFLLITSDLYKMKLFNVTTKMCRKTLLGPTFGTPVKKMLLLPPSKEGVPSSRYMAYITQDKVGLHILPLDGNPFKSSALICHSEGVSSLACSYDGRYVFTAGGVDKTVFSWEVSLAALEAAAALGGKELIPFYTLLDGGRDGEMFRMMEDLFYYCQLRNQGIDSMETRQVSTHIPLTEVPFVMRALGFYPTEQELEDMQNEVKFSRYAETGKYVTDIDLEEFIKLYVNHRPVFGISKEELLRAFQVLGVPNESGQPVITREELLDLLQARGEHMTDEELADCFMTLSGFGEERDRTETGALQRKDPESLLEGVLPPSVTTDTFAADILGFPSDSQKLPPEEGSS